jgi:hypothetical protein
MNQGKVVFARSVLPFVMPMVSGLYQGAVHFLNKSYLFGGKMDE